MSQKSKNESLLFKPDTEGVLVRGLNAMTKACDALSSQNEQLNKDIEALKRKVARLQDRIIINTDDKERPGGGKSVTKVAKIVTKLTTTTKLESF